MKLDEFHEVEKDTFCYILKYRESKGINTKTGKEEFASRDTYHANLTQVLKAYSNKIIDVDKSIIELKESIDLMNAKMNEFKKLTIKK
jgi:hypothetical protein